MFGIDVLLPSVPVMIMVPKPKSLPKILWWTLKLATLLWLSSTVFLLISPTFAIMRFEVVANSVEAFVMRALINLIKEKVTRKRVITQIKAPTSDDLATPSR